VPLSAESVPVPLYLDDKGRRLPPSAPPEKIARAIYEIRIKQGLVYQPHPAFAKGPDGRPLYADLSDDDLSGIDEIGDFKETGTREARSDDFIYQIMRLADPRVESPILSILEKYILGLREFSEALRADLEEVRRQRRLEAGPSYNRALDEESRPIILDYSAHPLPGVERVDDYTYRIILKTRYPQFIYWLAMPFFAPVPAEAAEFYSQGPLERRNITLDRFPVGTGPYMIETYNPNMEITLAKNPNFHGEKYPYEGEDGDLEAGLLRDSGEPLPFIDRIVFKLEKEAIPRWNKFLQGWYDNSGISSESFDSAVSISASGRAALTSPMKARGMRLVTSVRPSTFYAGFNMLDPVVGGYSERAIRLRQAISIALDFEEYIEIFNNGRGIAAMGPLPPGIFGNEGGREGINPFVYEWDAKKKRARRRGIEYARRLMSRAGYPGGRDSSGAPLVITFDNPWTGADSSHMINWYAKRFRLLGIRLENRTTDYNRFREKMRSGNFEFFTWGWNADYPDPENFLFLLAGDNSKVRFGGENVANYSNAAFDRLFRRMEKMDNSPERLKLIRRMTRMVQRDAPWVWGFHPVSFTLYHGWVHNVKPNAMANNAMKYIRIDAAARRAARERWNRPNLRPLLIPAAVLILLVAAAAISVRRRRTRG